MHFVIALIFLLSVIFTVVGYCYRKCISKGTRYSSDFYQLGNEYINF